MFRKLIWLLIFCMGFGMSCFAQSLAQIKKELETTPDPIGYVKFKLKKKYKIDTVAVVSTASFMGIADSLAYKGKVGKVYGPFKGENVLVKILMKLLLRNMNLYLEKMGFSRFQIIRLPKRQSS